MNEVRTKQAKGSVEIAVLVKDYGHLTAINTDLKARLATLEPRVRALLELINTFITHRLTTLLLQSTHILFIMIINPNVHTRQILNRD